MDSATPHLSDKTKSVALVHLTLNVNTLRDHYGWSFAELSRRAKLSLSLTKRVGIGRANPRVTDLFRISSVLGVPLKDLVERQVDCSRLPTTPARLRRYNDLQRIAETLSRRIRYHRLRCQLTCRSFARVTGIGRNALHDMEMKRIEPSTVMMERVATALGMSLADFLEDSVAEVREAAWRKKFPTRRIGPAIPDPGD